MRTDTQLKTRLHDKEWEWLDKLEIYGLTKDELVKMFTWLITQACAGEFPKMPLEINLSIRTASAWKHAAFPPLAPGRTLEDSPTSADDAHVRALYREIVGRRRVSSKKRTG